MIGNNISNGKNEKCMKNSEMKGDALSIKSYVAWAAFCRFKLKGIISGK